LKPEIVADPEKHYANNKQAERREKLIDVVGGLPLQQSSLLYETLQLDIFVARGSSGGTDNSIFSTTGIKDRTRI
jgi:hypothetical protein